MRRLSLCVLFGVSLASSSALAQRYDVDMSTMDSLGKTGGKGSNTATINRPNSKLGAGPQIDLSGKLSDTMSANSSAYSDTSVCSFVSCDYGVESLNGSTPPRGSGIEAMKSGDSMR